MSQPFQAEPSPPDAHEPTEPTGPISKRRAKRELERRVTQKATELNHVIKTQITEGANELGIPSVALQQRFAIIAPVGEKRQAMWWNGLIADRAAAWKAEYGKLSYAVS